MRKEVLLLTKKICVIGGGKWGKNHIRTLYEIGHLGGIVESDKEKLNSLLDNFPCESFENIEEAINNGFTGYVVATPAETHYEIGKTLLEKGKNVLIEKPLALSSIESEELVKIAEQNGVQLMVGHLLLFHPAIRKIKEIVDQGKIGNLYYIYSNRLNLGTVRTEENVFWSFAPHDISVMEYLVGQPPIEIQAKGTKFLQNDIEDVTITQLTYPDNVHGHIFVSWLHPFKEQRLVLVGSKGMISFEDSSKDKEIKFYNKKIDWESNFPVKVEKPDEVIDYQGEPPLKKELEYFIENLDKKIEIADGRSGHEVIKVLEKAQEFLEKGKNAYE